MHSARANGLDISYRSYGPDDGALVLVVQGVGAALTAEADPFAERLAARGLRVVQFDNRDSGASTHLDDAGVPDFAAIGAAAAAGEPLPIAYTLEDMARDAIGLLDALGARRAHVVGGSSGGMIAQIIAAEHPDRTASLTLVSTTSANPSLARGDAPVDEAGMTPGTARQAAAAAVAGDLRTRARRIAAPTIVVHGSDDPLFPLAHGRDLAATIPDAELRVVEGMGHVPGERDLEVIADAVVDAVRRGDAAARSAGG